MDAVTDNNMKLKAASQTFGILATSFKDHLYDETKSKQRSNCPTLKPNEEKKMVDYIFKMHDLRHPLTPTKLRLKVALAIQTREMPWSARGIFDNGWLKRFRSRHPKITTKSHTV